MFFFVIAIVLGLIGLVIGIMTLVNKQVGVGTAIVAVTLVVVGILMLLACGRVVPTGHTGVVTSFGRVENYTLDAGINFMAPWKRVVKMDNRVQKETVNMSCFSSDIQEVTMVYTINYQISQNDAMTIYSTIGKDYYTKIIMPTMMESVKVVCLCHLLGDP